MAADAPANPRDVPLPFIETSAPEPAAAVTSAEEVVEGEAEVPGAPETTAAPEESVQPLPGLISAEFQPPLEATGGLGVETSEEVFLEASGISEFSVPDASEDLKSLAARLASPKPPAPPEEPPLAAAASPPPLAPPPAERSGGAGVGCPGAAPAPVPGPRDQRSVRCRLLPRLTDGPALTQRRGRLLDFRPERERPARLRRRGTAGTAGGAGRRAERRRGGVVRRLLRLGAGRSRSIAAGQVRSRERRSRPVSVPGCRT